MESRRDKKRDGDDVRHQPIDGEDVGSDGDGAQLMDEGLVGEDVQLQDLGIASNVKNASPRRRRPQAIDGEDVDDGGDRD